MCCDHTIVSECAWDIRDDFGFDLEFRDILFVYTESRQILMQKREYHEIQDQNQNRP